MLLWLVLATAVGQVVAWTVEGVRRLRFGEVGVRLVTVAAVVAVLLLQLDDRLVPLLDQVPCHIPLRRYAVAAAGSSIVGYGSSSCCCGAEA